MTSGLTQRRPQLALPFTVLPQPDVVLLVAGEDIRFTLTGPGLERWLPDFLHQCQGSRRVEQLLAGMDDSHRAVALALLERLYGERILVDGSALAAHPETTYQLLVEGTGPLPERIRREVGPIGTDGLPRLVIFCQDRLDFAAALDCQRRCRGDGQPWLWVSNGAMQRGYVSPLFLPDAGPCFGCLLRSFQRLSPAPEVYDALLAHGREHGTIESAPFPPVGLAILLQLVLWKSMLTGAANPPAALYRLHVLERDSMEVSTHRLFVDPECRECGEGQP